MPQILVGALPDDGTGDTLRAAGLKINQWGELNDKTVNAAFYKTAGMTTEAALNLAIPAAALLGVGATVWIPASMLPYNAALVTFNSNVRMIREGGDLTRYDIRAYGAAGDNATNDTAAIQACLTAARAGFNSNNAVRDTVYASGGTYIFNGTLDFSDVSVWGDGQIATSFKLMNGAGAVSPLILIAGGQATYINWNLDGNRVNNVGAFQNGVQFLGAALWTTWINVYIHDTTGNGMMMSASAGLRPIQHQFINLTIRMCDRIGLRLNAGRNLGFYNLDVENVGLLSTGLAGIALTGTDEPCLRVVFDNLYMEKIGTTIAAGDGIEIDAGDKIRLRGGNIQEYGLAAGGGGNGINILGGSRIEIDSLDFTGRAASQANQRAVKIAASITGVILRGMSLTAADLEDNSTTGSSHLTQRTASPIIRPTEAVLVSGVDVSAGDTVIPAALTAARLVGVPLNPVQGQRVLWTIIQDGTGGRTVTWNAVFKLTWSDTGNTLNKRSSIATVFDGTNWNQDGAQTPYVP